MGSIPGLRRSPGGGHANPLQYSCLGNPMDRGAWQAIVHGAEKSRTWLCLLSRRHRFDPWVSKILREWQPTPVFLPGESHRFSRWASPWGCKESPGVGHDLGTQFSSVTQSCPTLRPHGLHTQESNQGLLHCRRILYQLSYKGSPFQIQSSVISQHLVNVLA